MCSPYEIYNTRVRLLINRVREFITVIYHCNGYVSFHKHWHLFFLVDSYPENKPSNAYIYLAEKYANNNIDRLYSYRQRGVRIDIKNNFYIYIQCFSLIVKIEISISKTIIIICHYVFTVCQLHGTRRVTLKSTQRFTRKLVFEKKKKHRKILQLVLYIANLTFDSD